VGKIEGIGKQPPYNSLIIKIFLDCSNPPSEVNEDKFGSFTPGTNIPIISEEEARGEGEKGKGRKPDYFLVLPWHFRAGILEREQKFQRDGGKFIFPLPEIEIV
jgi:hypothetical protein